MVLEQPLVPDIPSKANPLKAEALAMSAEILPTTYKSLDRSKSSAVVIQLASGPEAMAVPNLEYETEEVMGPPPNWAEPDALIEPSCSNKITVLLVALPLVNLKKLPVKNSWEVEAAILEVMASPA